MSGKKMEMRKVLLFLPLVLLPFLALGFYALGGGTVLKEAAAVQGINTALPDAQFKQADPKDKLGIYELAGKDSSVGIDGRMNGVKDVADRLGFEQADPKAKEIRDKLAVITRQVNGSGSGAVAAGPGGVLRGAGSVAGQVDLSGSGFGAGSSGAAEVSRLEQMMRDLKQQNGSADDPEMRQLNTLMDKILEAQHPDRLKDKVGQGSADPVIVGAGRSLVVPDSLFRAIPAIIEGKQKVAEGSSVKMRLMDTMVVNGQVIPKGSLVWGLASVSNQRLLLEVRNVGLGNRIIPVSLTVFDKKDAMVGINAPEALIAEAAGSGADNALQGMQFLGMDQSLGVQAAGAGITAAKSLFSRKVRKIRVKLNAGYPLLLRDNTRKLK